MNEMMSIINDEQNNFSIDFKHFQPFFIWAWWTDGQSLSWRCYGASGNHPTLPSIATATKETFIVRKAFMLRNSALFYLEAHDLQFFHAKFQSPGSNGLATTPFWVKKLVNKFEQILKSEIFQYKSKFLQLFKKFEKCKNLCFYKYSSQI